MIAEFECHGCYPWCDGDISVPEITLDFTSRIFSNLSYAHTNYSPNIFNSTNQHNLS